MSMCIELQTCTVYFSIMRQKDEQPTLTQTNTEENLETVYHEPFVDKIKACKKIQIAIVAILL